MTNYDRMLIEGREEDVKVIGTDDHYAAVRNLVLLSGRFLDWSDVSLREKVALLTERLARRLYGSPQSATGQVLPRFWLSRFSGGPAARGPPVSVPGTATRSRSAAWRSAAHAVRPGSPW